MVLKSVLPFITHFTLSCFVITCKSHREESSGAKPCQMININETLIIRGCERLIVPTKVCGGKCAERKLSDRKITKYAACRPIVECFKEIPIRCSFGNMKAMVPRHRQCACFPSSKCDKQEVFSDKIYLKHPNEQLNVKKQLCINSWLSP